MISNILIAGTLLTVCTLYIYIEINEDSPFYRVCRSFLVFMLIHFGHALVCQVFFNLPQDRYLDWAAPYGLLYGPFLFFAVKTSASEIKNRSTFIIHALPFIVFALSYLTLVSFEEFRLTFLQRHRSLLYLSLAVSFFCYSFTLLLAKKKIRRLLTLYAIILFAVALLFISGIRNVRSNRFQGDFEWPRAVIYGLMFMVVSILFRHGIQRFSVMKSSPKKSLRSGDAEDPVSKAYNKSAVAPEILAAYNEKLLNAMKQEKMFLDQELSLERLAAQLKIPRHHLTQLFNVYIKTNFYQYVNSYRINYACELMNNEDQHKSLDEISFMSGFNSKTSFNKYFRQQMGCTPSEYRKRRTGQNA